MCRGQGVAHAPYTRIIIHMRITQYIPCTTRYVLVRFQFCEHIHLFICICYAFHTFDEPTLFQFLSVYSSRVCVLCACFVCVRGGFRCVRDGSPCVVLYAIAYRCMYVHTTHLTTQIQHTHRHNTLTHTIHTYTLYYTFNMRVSAGPCIFVAPLISLVHIPLFCLASIV